jgi:GINS complex subunit 2
MSSSRNAASNLQSSHRAYAITNFLAMDSTIDIVPSFNYKSQLDFLISHNSVGPFYAGVNTTVPLWIALYLRKRNLCRLVIPEWMSLENLKNVLDAEVADKEKFSNYDSLPFRYKEISRSIFQACGVGRSHAQEVYEEIPNVEQIRILLEDIGTTRMNKIRNNVHGFSAGLLSETKPIILTVDGIGSAEINAIRPFFETVFRDHLRMISASATQDNGRVTEESTDVDPEKPVAVAPRSSRLRRYVIFFSSFMTIMLHAPSSFVTEMAMNTFWVIGFAEIGLHMLHYVTNVNGGDKGCCDKQELKL